MKSVYSYVDIDGFEKDCESMNPSVTSRPFYNDRTDFNICHVGNTNGCIYLKNNKSMPFLFIINDIRASATDFL